MAVMIVAHPIPGFSGRVSVEDVGLSFIGGFTGPTEVPAEVQAQLVDEGFTLNASPSVGYPLAYVTHQELEDPDSEPSVALRAAYVPWDEYVPGEGGGGGSTTPFDVTEGGLLHAIFSGATTRPVRVVFTGSSTTEDYDNQPADRYVNRLAKMIQAAYPSGQPTEAPVVLLATGAASPSSTPGIQVFNGGKGGTTSINYLASGRRENIITLQPNVVFHMIGANNWSSNYNPNTYKTEVANEIAALDAGIADPLVHVLVHSFPMQNLTSPTYQWSDYGDKLREIATADPDRIYFIDISQPFLDADIEGADPLDLLGPDDAHTTDAGQALIASSLARALNLPTPPGGASANAGAVLPPVPAGLWVFTTCPQLPSTSNTMGNGTLRVLPWRVESQQTIDRLCADVSIAGEAGSKVRLGIYADNGGIYPGALMVDGGQINGDSATVQQLTISPTTLAPGLYWVAAVVQSAVTTQPTLRVNTTTWTPPVLVPYPAGTFAPGVGGANAGYSATGVTGALPSTFPTGAASISQAPRVAVRTA